LKTIHSLNHADTSLTL